VWILTLNAVQNRVKEAQEFTCSLNPLVNVFPVHSFLEMNNKVFGGFLWAWSMKSTRTVVASNARKGYEGHII
jgi:hypothetical protein